MLDIKFIRENIEAVKRGIAEKSVTIDLDAIIALDDKRKVATQEFEALRAEQNSANEEMARLKKEGGDFKAKVEEMKSVAAKVKTAQTVLSEIKAELDNHLLYVPNLPHVDAPVGGQEANVIVREWMPSTNFVSSNLRSCEQGKAFLDHLEIAEKHGWIDMERGTKIAGRGFVLYKGFGAKLERALISFMIDYHVEKHGYTEVFPPFLVNRATMTATGQLPKMEEDMYALKDDPFFLIPTAEVPVTNIHRDETLTEAEIPIKYVAYTPCFRREAGSYGKDTRGLSRVHQFDKVEMVQFVKPEESYAVLETLVNDAEDIVKALELPYRVLELATGDLSFAAAKCYDIEVYAKGSKAWFEVSSCSNFVDFQARRGNIKFKREGEKKAEFVHTLNGSGLALARIVLALLENGQQEDGTVFFPSALQKYL